MTLRACFVLLLCSIFHFLEAQEPYAPLSTEPPSLEESLKGIKTRYKEDLNRLPEKNNEPLEEIFTKRYDRVTENIKDGHYYFDPVIERYFRNVITEISRNNPELNENTIRLFVSRYTWPNATCLGEGTLVFNIGLIRRLESESQLAFVICHEWAHFLQNHVNNAIFSSVEQLYSEDTQNELENISKSEYGKMAKAMTLMKGMVYDTRRHSRLNEKEADSLALTFLLRTKYDPFEAMGCLAILDRIDGEKYGGSARLKETFNFEDYPFRDYWLSGSSSSIGFGGDEEDPEWEKDSLKTHPDCSQRIAFLASYLDKLENTSEVKFLQPESEFENLVQICDMEMLASSMTFEDYGRSLFFALKELEQKPEEGYIYATIGKTLFNIYKSQEIHQLDKYVQFPSKELEPSYKEVLTFIHNLRLKELARIGYYFMEKNGSRFGDQEEFLFAWWQWSKLGGNPEQAKKLKSKYMKLFPKGKYTDDMKKS